MPENKEKKQIVITTTDGKPFTVPPEGSLGLLALGYKGLIAWRQVRRRFEKFKKENQSGDQAGNAITPENKEEKNG